MYILNGWGSMMSDTFELVANPKPAKPGDLARASSP